MFPVWFLYRALTVAINDLSNGMINAALNVRRLVLTGAEIVRLACIRDVDGMKELFRSGLASPNDSDASGCTVLRVCDSPIYDLRDHLVLLCP